MGLKEILLELSEKIITAEGSCLTREVLGRQVTEVAYELKGLAKGLTDVPTKWVPEAAAGRHFGVEGEINTQPYKNFGTHKELSHQKVYEQAQIEARQAKQKADIESVEPKITRCVDGPEEGLYVPVDPSMPEGGFTKVGGATYELKEGKLVWKGA